MRQDLGHRQHLARGHALGVEKSGPILGRLRLQGLLDLALELIPVREAVLAILEAGIIGQIGTTNEAGQRLELLLLVGRDVQEAVARGVGAGRARGHVLVAHRLGDDAADQAIGHLPAHGGEDRFEHRDVDEVAGTRLAAALSLIHI